jgi:hypothetical protein
MHESLNISQQMIEQTLKILNDPTSHLLLKLRALWLLEKLNSSFVVRNSKDVIGKEIFQSVSDLFAHSTEFVLNYQSIKTLHKYIRLIDIKTAYPLNYQ